jgi:hypothetical protein
MTNYSLIEAVKVTIMACFKMQPRMTKVFKKIMKKEVKIFNTNENL